MIVDPAVSRPSGLLHEAGHLACVPAEYRHLFSGDVAKGQQLMLDQLEASGADIDSPLYRAVIQTSDPEATAWAFAAGLAIGLKPQQIILDDEYDGEGWDVRFGLSSRRYLGINGLANAGFCCTSARLSAYTGLPAYPNLRFWLQPAGLSRYCAS